MKSVDYLKIIKESAETVWRKKILTLFGFFIFLGSLGGSIVFQGDGENVNRSEVLADFISAHATLLFWIAAFLLVLSVCFLFLRAVGVGALIRFSSGLVYSENVTFKELFNLGRSHALKIIIIDIALSVAILALLITLTVPVLFLVFSNARAIGFIIGIIACAIIIPVAVLVYYIKRFAYIILVVSGVGIKNALEKAYGVFSENVLESFVFSFFIMLIYSVFFFVTFFIAAFAGVTVAVPGVIFYLALSKITGYAIFALAIFIACVIFVFAQACWDAFSQVAWVLFFKELKGIKTDEKKKMLEELSMGRRVEAENA